jgi:hypothetical protein
MKQFNATMRKQLNATTRTTLTRDCFSLKAGRSEHYSFISFSLSVLLLLSLFLDYPSMHHCIRPAPTTQHPLFVNHLTKSSTTQYTPPALAFSRTHSCSFTPLYTFLFLLFLINFHYLSLVNVIGFIIPKETQPHHSERRNGMFLVLKNLAAGCYFQIVKNTHTTVGGLTGADYYYYRRLLFLMILWNNTPFCCFFTLFFC